MAYTREYRDWVLEQLRYLGPVTARSMFGGAGLYCDGLFFALIDEDTLYFKVDDSNRGDFEAAGTGPFRPYGDDRAMGYYEVPAEVIEEPDRLKEWAEKAVAVARAAKRKK
jgi:DNA transformation protein and related proteins